MCKAFHPSAVLCNLSLSGEGSPQPSMQQPVPFLLQLGVTTLGGRRRLQRAAAQLLREEPPASQPEDQEDCWKQVPAGPCEGEQSGGPEACWEQAAQLPAGQCAGQQTDGSEGGWDQEAHQRPGHSAEERMNGAVRCWEHGPHQRSGQSAEPLGSSPAMQPHSLPDTLGSPCDSVDHLTQLYDAEQPAWEGQPGAGPGGVKWMAAEEDERQEPQFEALLWAAKHSVGASEEAGLPSVDGGGSHLEATQQWQTLAAAPDAGCTCACADVDWQLCSGTSHAEAAPGGAMGNDEVVSLLTQEGHCGSAGNAVSALL